jgi:GT2 family glycosyltransferase/glycosyltransferase involved in cell wall biosynthesis
LKVRIHLTPPGRVARGSGVKVLFASAAEECIPPVIESFGRQPPDLPLVLISEFPQPACEWIPFHIERTTRENLELVHARLAGRRIAAAAVILDPNKPYRRLRWIAFRVAGMRLIAFDRRGQRTGVTRYLVRGAAGSVRARASRWTGRIARPSTLRRPFYYRTAWLAGLAAAWIKRGAPVAAAPALAEKLPEGVSVVIPSRNGRDLLERLLPGLVAQSPAEIIVVDNGSDDGTAEFLASRYPEIVVEHSAEPLGFAPAVNRGIARARFAGICLLNNDMLIEPGFFAALSAAFRRIPDLFCATAQVFFPEGRRREETGKAVMPTRRDPLAFPVRCDEPVAGEDGTYVLYGSGGCSSYDTAKLRALNSFAELFAPAYCEDLDLGFRAWRLGWPTVYCAGARVLHEHRATTSRYYPEAVLTRVLERNYAAFLVHAIVDRPLFRRLWKENTVRLNLAATLTDPAYVDCLKEAGKAPAWIEALPRATMPEPEILAIGSGDIAVFPGRETSAKPRVLVVSPYLPYPLAHGGAVRMFNLMRAAARAFDQVLIAFVDRLAPAPPELLELCVEIVCVRRYGTHVYPTSQRPDVVEEFDSAPFHAVLKQTVRKWRPAIAQLEFTQMAQYASDCAPAKTILVEHDITFDLYAQLLAQAYDWETKHQYERWQRFEKQAWADVHRVVTMSERDRGVVGRDTAVCLPNGVDVARFQPSPHEPDPRRLLFIGSFAHLPNLMALEFFLRDAWPDIAPSGATLHVIAGARHEYFLDRYRDRVKLDLDRPGVEVEDFVADVRPAYELAAVVIAPLVASAGTNIKILEAMAMGKAIVSTPAGINGLDLENGREVLVAENGAGMAAAIARLFEHPEDRREFERQARATAVARYGWDAVAAAQEKLYRGVL